MCDKYLSILGAIFWHGLARVEDPAEVGLTPFFNEEFSNVMFECCLEITTNAQIINLAAS